MSDRTGGDRVAAWESDGAMYVAVLPRGPITVLEGTAVTIWLAANAGPIEGVADRVGAAMGLEVEDIRASVEEFVDRLISAGLIPDSR